jgi:C1A family cysteine protease
MASFIISIYNKIIKKLLKFFKKKKYGWTPQPIDSRDHIYSPDVNSSKLPLIVDLRPKCPEVWHQGSLGSCSAHGVAFAHQFSQMKQGKKNTFAPSRLAIYYDGRKLINTINSDSGIYIRDGIKVIAKTGVAPESMWPYIVSKFKVSPSQEYYAQALDNQGVRYKAVPADLISIKSSLVEGFPVVFGFNVYESFESEETAKSGIMSIPKEGERLVGGHCVSFVGYNETKKMFICRNSWGSDWGDGGYFYMPYEIALKEATDLWQLSEVE